MRFFSTIIARSLSKRGTDGYIGEAYEEHYTFSNLFAFVLGQIIFYLTDKVILLENKLKIGDRQAYISTKITESDLIFSSKINNNYACYIPRYIIFDACKLIDYYHFTNSLSPKLKERFNSLMLTAQLLIDTCRTCENLRQRPQNIFINQNFCKSREAPIYLELDNEVRIIHSTSNSFHVTSDSDTEFQMLEDDDNISETSSTIYILSDSEDSEPDREHQIDVLIDNIEVSSDNDEDNDDDYETYSDSDGDGDVNENDNIYINND